MLRVKITRNKKSIEISQLHLLHNHPANVSIIIYYIFCILYRNINYKIIFQPDANLGAIANDDQLSVSATEQDAPNEIIQVNIVSSKSFVNKIFKTLILIVILIQNNISA